MRVLGLDIGERRVGVAISDPSATVASALTVLDGSVASDPAPLASIVEEYDVGSLVVGLPLTMAGEEGPQAHRVRAVAEELARSLRLPVHYVDERLSSSQAKDVLARSGHRSRAQRGRVDKVAAAILLQTYLDMQSHRTGDTTG